MKRPVLRYFIILLALSCPLLAHRGGTGSVTGHVMCGDAHLPARLASVMLQPVVAPEIAIPRNNSPAIAPPLAPTEADVPDADSIAR